MDPRLPEMMMKGHAAPVPYFGDKAIKMGRGIRYRHERAHDDEMQFIITGITRLSKYMNCS